MKAVSELEEILNGFSKCYKSYVNCLAKMLLGLCIVKTVNLNEIAGVMEGKAKQESHYRRLQRFFQYVRFDYDLLAQWIMKLFFSSGKPCYLTLDRTNWEWGEKGINILVLAIVYKGIAIPIFCTVLNHKGCTSVAQKRALVSRFIKVFGKGNIAGLLADREFASKEFFRYLVWKEIPFFIRIKGGTLVENGRGKKVKASKLFSGLKAGEKWSIGKRIVFNRELSITGAKSPKEGELMIVVSSVETEEAIEKYLQRWKIETLFGCLKGKGFRFEDTHMTDRKKIKKMVGILAVAFCWCYKIGEWRNAEREPIKLKKHGRLAVSIFRYGADFLRKKIMKATSSFFKICLKIGLHFYELGKGASSLAYGAVL
jgi:hypothetical protein